MTPTPPAPKQAEAFTFGMEKVPATCERSLRVAAFKVGDRTRATQSIYEGPDDYGPGGYLCRKGDLLIVRKVRGPDSLWRYSVSHEEITDCAFLVTGAEIELDASRALAQQEAK